MKTTETTIWVRHKLPKGPNHRDNCEYIMGHRSGSEYNRVIVCLCGAEDHDPDVTEPLPSVRDLCSPSYHPKAESEE